MAIFISLAPSTVYAQATITACQNTSDGTLRIVSASTTCKKNETKISWPTTDGDLDTLGDLSCSDGATVKRINDAWACDGPPPRYVDNGNGTISDNQTGLMWEKKTDCSIAGDIHCVGNRYLWTNSDDPSAVIANGPLFRSFWLVLTTRFPHMTAVARFRLLTAVLPASAIGAYRILRSCCRSLIRPEAAVLLLTGHHVLTQFSGPR
jgi:hypothetical protein